MDLLDTITLCLPKMHFSEEEKKKQQQMSMNNILTLDKI